MSAHRSGPSVFPVLFAIASLILMYGCASPPAPVFSMSLDQHPSPPAANASFHLDQTTGARGPVFDLGELLVRNNRIQFHDEYITPDGKIRPAGNSYAVKITAAEIRDVLRSKAEQSGIQLYDRPVGYLTCEDRKSCQYLLFPFFIELRNLKASDGYFIDVSMQALIYDARTLAVVGTNSAWGRVRANYDAYRTTQQTNNTLVLEAISRAAGALFSTLAPVRQIK